MQTTESQGPGEGPERKRDKRRGLLIVGVAFFAALSISWWARSKAAPEAEPPAPPTSDGVVGFPSKVDFVATLEAARSHTKRKELRGIVASGVRSDGTIDLAAPGSRVRYLFTSARGEGPQPPHAPGTLPVRAFCGRQNVHVKQEGMVADPDQSSSPCPPEHTDALPSPRCGPKDIWQKAIARGAPANQLALIEYLRTPAGPAWRFDIAGSGHRFVLYGDCERELVGHDATGTIP